MLEVISTTSFKKDLKRVQKRGKDLNKLMAVIELLRNQTPLPPKYKDHSLSGKYAGYRDCHIEPDWILVYRIENNQLQLILAYTGTHSDLF